MIELNGGFLRLGAYRVEGVNTMYIGAGNPLGSIQTVGKPKYELENNPSH